MKLTSTIPKVTVAKGLSGVLQAEFEHEIKSTTARLNYTGPKISPQVWREILSFFKWTQDTTQSEAQVRLYVNPLKAAWGAWAFPQKARTGMSAQELDTPETPEAAALRFAHWSDTPNSDWIYFGTVHHHCSMSAFQSGTDKSNEEHQDGLHITIGHLDSLRHDFHARFYLGGCHFEPDLGLFWDIGPELAALTPPDTHDHIARYQMCQHISVPFPEQWRENLIEVKTAALSLTGYKGFGAVETVGRTISNHGQHEYINPWQMPEWRRIERVADAVIAAAKDEAVGNTELLKITGFLTDELVTEILRLCKQYEVSPDQLMGELQYLEESGWKRPERSAAAASLTENSITQADQDWSAWMDK